ncbi:MAG: nitroreductase family deazaflavin-dependent oxidoreductase [Myxococcota bacterium]|nr:nitroreductase family deazaflavin-dependent oxidoreductase [Myxococcota bacterium]
MDGDLSHLERHWNCRLTTRGRRSGEPRAVTIWFALGAGTVYLTASASHPHWCRNLEATAEVSLRIGNDNLTGIARLIEDPGEARAVRQRFVDRYWLARLSRPFGGYRDSIPVAVEIREA